MTHRKDNLPKMTNELKKNELNFSLIAKQYSDEEEAYKFLENIRWENGVICPHCGNIGAGFIEPENGNRKTRTGAITFRRIWRCESCKKQFSVLVGTIFENSRIPLSKWLLAIHELNSDKNGVSSCELGRKLGITQKSAWFMAQRIRFAMAHTSLEKKLSGTVEVDETYIGGLEKNKHQSKRTENNQGRSTKTKTPVLSAVQRGGMVYSKSMTTVSSKNIREVLKERVSNEAVLETDTFPAYNSVAKNFAGHEVVDHGIGEYVRGIAHTNTAEGYFSQLKRSLSGTFHHVSEKHLDRYLAEFDYRYNSRKEKDGERTKEAIRRVAGKRLTYQDLIAKA
jgi:transposase-like protein